MSSSLLLHWWPTCLVRLILMILEMRSGWPYTWFFSGWSIKDLFNLAWLIGQVRRVFTNDPGDLGSIPGHVIPKTLKMILDTSLLNTQQYKVRKGVKRSNPSKGVAPSPTPHCNSYWKKSLPVALDYGRQLSLLISVQFPSTFFFWPVLFYWLRLTSIFSITYR